MTYFSIRLIIYYVCFNQIITIYENEKKNLKKRYSTFGTYLKFISFSIDDIPIISINNVFFKSQGWCFRKYLSP